MRIDAARFSKHCFFKRKPCRSELFPYRSGYRLSRSGGLIADARAFVKPLLQRRGASDKSGKVHIRMRALRNGIDQTGFWKQRRFIQQRLHRKGGKFFANSISLLNPIGRCTFRSITLIY